MCEQAAWLFLALVLCVRVTELIQHFILQIRKLWVIQIKSFLKVTHLVDEAIRI